MATLITKNSSTASSVPTAAQLVQGELAVNVTDKRLFTENASGTVVELGTNPSSLALPNGSANGVAYLNGSKVLTTGSALTFDGTNLGIGRTPRSVAGYGILSIDGSNGGATDWYANGTRIFTAYAGTTAANISTAGAIPLVFQINDTEGMRLTSTGLGIGTSSPGFRLTVVGASGAGGTVAQFSPFTGTDPALLKFNNAGAGDFFIGKDNSAGNAFGSGAAYAANLYNGANTPMLFWTNATKQMTLDTSGNLGLGVTPSAWSGIYKAFQVGSQSALATYNSSTDLGFNWFYGGSDKYIVNGAAGMFRIDGDGSFKWYRAPSGTAGNAISFTQAMTLDASGSFYVGTTNAAYSTDRVAIVPTGSNGTGIGIACPNNSSVRGIGIYHGYASGANAATMMQFQNSSSGVVGSITSNGSTTAYNVTSDQRLKENIQDADSASALIDALQVRKYDWKSDGSHQRYGFIAQELVTLAPEAVHQPEDPEEMMAVDYSKLVPMLVKEIQSLRKRLAALETK